jgi:hypothetical protein
VVVSVTLVCVRHTEASERAYITLHFLAGSIIYTWWYQRLSYTVRRKSTGASERGHSILQSFTGPSISIRRYQRLSYGKNTVIPERERILNFSFSLVRVSLHGGISDSRMQGKQ